MAMTGAGLKAAMLTKFQARPYWATLSPTAQADVTNFADDIATAIVSYVQANAAIAPGALAVGVTAGGASVPVTGGIT